MATARQIESVVEYLHAGSKPPEDYRIGLEVEHLVINKTTGLAVSYLAGGDRAPNGGIEQVLHALKPLYSQEISENGYLLGLIRPGASLTLEPGAQVECSLGPAKDVAELERLYAQFRSEVDAQLEKIGAQALTFGYHETSKFAEVLPLIPKARYAIMDEYLGEAGQFGRNMMRCSASTQVSIDYSSEADAIQKLRLAQSKSDEYQAQFSNSPYFEGEPNTNKLLRKKLWYDLDPWRSGPIPGLFEDSFGFEEYAKYILSVPLMVADFQHTPEVLAKTAPGDLSKLVVIAKTQSAGELYPDRALNRAEIEHIISTFFFDVRLKNFIELRSVDSLPIDRALEYATLVVKEFYGK